MDKGTVHIYCGKGKGKTTAAIGQAIKAACEGRNVVIIEFLKAKEEDELGFLKRLEPEIKVFRFFVFQTKKKLHVRDFFHPYVIADLRKEKQMTQAELPERLHVTDKAVSRWKRGLDIRISIR